MYPEDRLRKKIAETLAKLADLRTALRAIETTERQWSRDECAPIVAIAAEVGAEAGLTVA